MRRLAFPLLVLLATTQFGCPQAPVVIDGNPRVRVTTSLGDFLIEVLPELSPLTVDNFLEYVDEGFYDGLVFHRVVDDFVVQGGNFRADLTAPETRAPIANESRNGLRNARRTVSAARELDPESATSGFFINLIDNPSLDPTLTAAGYAVFGFVVEGMDVVDAIGAVPTETVGEFEFVPATPVTIESTTLEPGEPRLSPEWEQFLTAYGLQAADTLRGILIQLIVALPDIAS